MSNRESGASSGYEPVERERACQKSPELSSYLRASLKAVRKLSMKACVDWSMTAALPVEMRLAAKTNTDPFDNPVACNQILQAKLSAKLRESKWVWNQGDRRRLAGGGVVGGQSRLFDGVPIAGFRP